MEKNCHTAVAIVFCRGSIRQIAAKLWNIIAESYQDETQEEQQQRQERWKKLEERRNQRNKNNTSEEILREKDVWKEIEAQADSIRGMVATEITVIAEKDGSTHSLGITFKKKHPHEHIPCPYVVGVCVDVNQPDYAIQLLREATPIKLKDQTLSEIPIKRNGNTVGLLFFKQPEK